MRQMSILAMVDEAVQISPAKWRVRRRSRTRRESVESPLAEVGAGLIRHIPTEAVALYTAILPFLITENSPLDEQNFTSRWVLAVIVGIMALLFAVGNYRRKLLARQRQFSWPSSLTVTVLAAYAGWVLMIPGSPVNTFDWYTPSLGSVIGIAISFAITLFHLWFPPEDT